MITAPARVPTVGIPGFPGGYDVMLRTLRPELAPDASAALGAKPGDRLLVSISNQRWDRAIFGGTKGDVRASVVLVSGGRNASTQPQALHMKTGKGGSIPGSVRDAMAGLDAAMRDFAVAPGHAYPVGTPDAGPNDARNAYAHLLRAPIAVPIQPGDSGELRSLAGNDAVTQAVTTAAAAVADALAK